MPGSSDRPVAGRVLPDPMSAMSPRFNVFFRWFARRFFGHFDLDDRMVARLQALEQRGAVIFVMRYASRLDYFLFNTLFRREGIRLSAFANGLRFYYYRPLFEALRFALRRRRGVPHEVVHSEDRERVRRVVAEGRSCFLFLRTQRRPRFGLWRREERRDDLDLIQEVVREVWDSGREVAVVPLSLFWRKGPRTEGRFLNLSYGGATRPTDVAKVSSFLATYRTLSAKAGEPIELTRFVAERREEGPEQVARKVRRSILMYLYREEKIVEGPPVRSPMKVWQEVSRDPRLRAAIALRGRDRRSSPERARIEAERMFREIAANMNSTQLALLNWIVTRLFRRLFGAIEVNGLEKVADYARRHPLVLVPSHRSYFDFLIVSWLFYANYLVPPHIAARENMAFGPFGFVFRRCGAFFLRKSFDDPLYKEVFRSYVAYLVREGFTQEFFIEGGRSRTGKTLAPRMGMLNWNVEAFLDSPQRDLFFVPISITYERLVEEGAMVGELEGEKKRDESMLGLVRARKVLERRFGSVYVNFGEPISLAAAIGANRRRFAAEESEEVVAEKRVLVEQLAHRIVERINWAAVANATAVASAVLLGCGHRGMLRSELTLRMAELVELLRLQDVRITPALLRDAPEFEEAISFLLRSDLIESAQDPRGEVLFFQENRCRALDLYRNAIVHFLAAPSFLARRLLRGATEKELREDLGTWHELLYQELFVPRGEILAAHFDAFLDHFAGAGWTERRGDRIVATDAGRASFRFLAEQTRAILEAYHVAVVTAEQGEGEFTLKEFRKRAAEQFERLRLLGEVQRIEGANDTTFGNALDLLVRRRILERREAHGDGAREALFARGECFGDIAELRERLAWALRSR